MHYVKTASFGIWEHVAQTNTLGVASATPVKLVVDSNDCMHKEACIVPSGDPYWWPHFGHAAVG